MDGFKMSKFKGNIVFFMDIIDEYGVDIVRFFVLFVVLLERDLDWLE